MTVTPEYYADFKVIKVIVIICIYICIYVCTFTYACQAIHNIYDI